MVKRAAVIASCNTTISNIPIYVYIFSSSGHLLSKKAISQYNDEHMEKVLPGRHHNGDYLLVTYIHTTAVVRLRKDTGDMR